MWIGLRLGVWDGGDGLGLLTKVGSCCCTPMFIWVLFKKV